jgi:hypothetical protein
MNKGKSSEAVGRTFTVYPHKGSLRHPLLERTAFGEPNRGSASVSLAGYNMVVGRIRRREPASDLLLQLVTCETVQRSAQGGSSEKKKYV